MVKKFRKLGKNFFFYVKSPHKPYEVIGNPPGLLTRWKHHIWSIFSRLKCKSAGWVRGREGGGASIDAPELGGFGYFTKMNSLLLEPISGGLVVPMGTTKPPEMGSSSKLFILVKYPKPPSSGASIEAPPPSLPRTQPADLHFKREKIDHM